MRSTDGEADLLSTGQAARLLGSSRQHVVDLCERGELPFVLVGAHRRVHRTFVERLISPELTRDQERSLWLHRAIAGRLVIDPAPVLERARMNLEHLRSVHGRGVAARYVERWRMLLDGDLDGVLDALTSPAGYAVELRQNSPFAGVLSEDDRQACLSAFRSHWRLEHAA